MKTFSDITSHLNIADRKPSIAQVRTDFVTWGKTNRSMRQRIRVQLWLDSDDQNDRIVVSADVVLNIKKKAPEKGVDMNFEIRHYSGYDAIKRCLTTSHPEQYLRIDGQSSPADIKSMYDSLFEQIGCMELSGNSVPGCIDYKAA